MFYDCTNTRISPGVVPEFFMNNTEVTNNLQHGVFLENVRNYAFVNASELSNNMYGAGLKVFGGAGKCKK